MLDGGAGAVMSYLRISIRRIREYLILGLLRACSWVLEKPRFILKYARQLEGGRCCHKSVSKLMKINNFAN